MGYTAINHDMGVSIDGGTPKSSMFIGFSRINHPFWVSRIYGKPLMLGVVLFSDLRQTEAGGNWATHLSIVND